MTENILAFKHVSKKFRNFQALDNVSFQIQKGDIYGLIGQNGAGKTTIMKLITDLSKATSGEIILFGESRTASYQKSLIRTAAIIEQPVAYHNLTAYENLKLYCIQKGIHDYSVIEEVLTFVGLTDTGKKKFKQFSLGMKQRLGLAITLLGNPDFLILDEPINGLDPIAIIEFRELLEKINRERNTTILISSHILSELYHVSTRFGFIHKGKLIQEISKQEFDAQTKEAIIIKVADKESAAVALTEGNCHFKIIDNQTIQVYDFIGSVADLNKYLLQKDVAVMEIKQQQLDLENYFTNLIENNGGI